MRFNQGKSVDFTGLLPANRVCQNAPFGLQYVVLSARRFSRLEGAIVTVDLQARTSRLGRLFQGFALSGIFGRKVTHIQRAANGKLAARTAEARQIVPERFIGWKL
jgi:hypothetical protein